MASSGRIPLVLVGRDQERVAIERALDSGRREPARPSRSSARPGSARPCSSITPPQCATGMRVLRARGIESEAEIPFAALLELLRPALAMLGAIPEPQAIALEGALALRRGPARERFAVGAATLSLLAAYAEEEPVAVLVDDAHWLDGSSAQALLFAFRRLVADPIAVLIAVREGDPSLLDGADLPTMRVAGLTSGEAATLLHGLTPAAAERLHGATAGNPLALIELADEAQDLALAPAGAPLLVSARISGAFLRRVDELDDAARRALVLAATSDSGDLSMLERAANRLEIDLAALAVAEAAGLVTLKPGSVEFRHPLARSAIYAAAPIEERRAAHRALAGALPDRDVDRRAWHLAATAVGTDDAASAALEQAGVRSRDRSSYVTAAGAFERAARLAAISERRARLLLDAAEAAWHAGLAERAAALLEDARAQTADTATGVAIDHLSGHITIRRGPVMRGYEILTTAAARADPERAVAMFGGGGHGMLRRGQAGGHVVGGRAGACGAPTTPRSGPVSWRRPRWGWPGSSAATRPPAPRQSTGPSRWRTGRRSSKTTSSCFRG